MDEELRSAQIEYKRTRGSGDQVPLAIESNFRRRGGPQGAQPPLPGTLDLLSEDNSYNLDLDSENNCALVDYFFTESNYENEEEVSYAGSQPEIPLVKPTVERVAPM